MYSGVECVCGVILSVYPHRQAENLLDHGGSSAISHPRFIFHPPFLIRVLFFIRIFSSAILIHHLCFTPTRKFSVPVIRFLPFEDPE